MGLLLHQHGHVLHVPAPQVQTLLHAFDLEGEQQTSETDGSQRSRKTHLNALLSDLLQVQDSGLHPGHLHLLVHLIDAAFNQAHRQSLHHQQLHLQDDSFRVVPSVFPRPPPVTLTSFTGILAL